MISLLRTACVLAVLAGICFAQEAESEKVVVEQNNTVLFNCSEAQHKMCSLKNGTITTKARAKRYGSEKCIMQIELADLRDTGDYICLYDEGEDDTGAKNFDLTVYARPSDVKLQYNGVAIEEGKKVVVDPDPNNFAQFTCIADGGFPQPSFVWIVNNEVKTSDEPLLIQDPSSQLWNARSQLKVDFEDEEYTANGNKGKEKIVQCIVQHVSYEKQHGETTLTAKAGRSYKTEKVTLKVVGNDLINPGEIKQIICEADGNPEPDNFKIEKKLDDDSWDPVAFEKTFNVTAAGVYSCSAYNEHNGLMLTDFVRSDEIRISEPGTEALRAGSDEVGTVIGIVIGTLLLIIIVVVVVIYLYRKERACFKQGGSNPRAVETLSSAENGTNDKMSAEKKAENAKGDQNENTKPKEIHYAELDLKITNGSNRPKSPQSEYAELKFPPKENQV